MCVAFKCENKTGAHGATFSAGLLNGSRARCPTGCHGCK